MAGPKPALYSAGITCLGFASLALAATAVGLPIWGNFESLGGGWEADRGYFGPWKVCKILSYGREICGREDFRFRPSGNYIIVVLYFKLPVELLELPLNLLELPI